MASQAPKVDIGSKFIFVISAVALLTVVYVLGSSLLNTYSKNSLKGEVDNSQLILTAEENLKPIGLVATAGEVVAGAVGRSGKEIYDTVCASCHATGVLDSPKLGDEAAWKTRATNGLAGLLENAANGKGSMPANGSDPSITDAELKAVVLYMTKEAGLDLGEAEEAPKAEPANTPSETTAKASSTSGSLKEGKAVYDTACSACHASGVAGSPKLGDKSAWTDRITQGIETLYTTALKGKGAMPAKGGNASLDDAKVKAAVDFMVDAVK